MLKTFVLLATIWHAPSESPRMLDVYVLDYGLTGADCVAAMEEGIADLTIDGVDLSQAVLSCEFDNGETEF